ncbi:MAG: hypothetical protein R2814_06080 [Flavobacteriaceae bacterium]
MIVAENRETPKLGGGIYNSTDISDILKIDRRQAYYLLQSYLNDKFRKTSQFNYRLSDDDRYSVNFLSLIEIYIFQKFKESGVTPQKIVKIHEFLSGKLKTPYPFASTHFFKSGNNIYFKDGDDWVITDKTLQIALRKIVESFGSKISFNNENLADKYYPLGKDRSIVIDPEYRFGQPILKNSFLPIEPLYETYKAENDDAELISHIYNISKSEIKDIVEFMETAA